MEVFQKEFIRLIHAAFSGEALDLSASFDWERATVLAQKHNIASILFYGATCCNLPRENAQMQQLYQLTLKGLMISTRQSYEISRIQEAFENEHIAYMPLKGILLKQLYPKPEMRAMGDADILIRLTQYDKIQQIMHQLGFSFQYESDHELVWKNPGLFLELHKSVMTSYNEDFYGYFGDGWKLARNIPGTHRHEMSPEDFYIYMFVHFAKHYRISGIGIKHILDLWVYNNANPHLNWTYIIGELQKIGLDRFHANVMDTLDVWFHSGADTDVTDLITNVIFNSGQYGTAEMAIVNRTIQNHSRSPGKIRLLKIVSSIFPPLDAMQLRYPVLRDKQFLLPIMWIYRCFDIICNRNSLLKRFVLELNLIDAKHLDAHTHALHFVGLDFTSDGDK